MSSLLPQLTCAHTHPYLSLSSSSAPPAVVLHEAVHLQAVVAPHFFVYIPLYPSDVWHLTTDDFAMEWSYNAAQLCTSS